METEPQIHYSGMETAIYMRDVNILNNTFRMENISLNIRKGFVTAIIGENNSGKTTLMETMAGIHGITKGEIIIEGYDLIKQPEKAKENTGFIFHKCPFDERLSASDCMKMFGNFYKTFDKGNFLNLCNEMKIDTQRMIRYMSKGQAVKLQLAFALAHDAKILLFDDAMEGLDPVFRIEVKRRLSDLMIDGNHTVVISTKLPEDLEGIADFVITLKSNDYGNTGKVEWETDMESIYEKGGIKEYFKRIEGKK